MAAVTHRAASTDTANATSYASGAFTPGANELLVVFVAASATAVMTPTLTDSQGLGFTRIQAAGRSTNASYLYCFVANALAAASSMTVTFDCTGDAATGASITVAGVSGMSRTGATAVRQSAKSENNEAGTTPAPVFFVDALTGNPTLGGVGNASNPAGMTPPTNWTERADVGYATPDAGLEYVSRDSGFTGTTITWGGTSASVHADVIVELDSSASAAPVEVIATRERPPDELAAYIENPDGSELRLAGDEPDAALADCEIATTLPGGFATSDAEVALRGVDPPTVRKFAEAAVRLPDRTSVWEGRVESTPERSAEGRLDLSMIGHQALLLDMAQVQFLGVDDDLTGWDEPPRERRKSEADASRSVNGAFSVDASEGGITITMVADRNVQTTASGEVWYLHTAPELIAEVQYVASETQTPNMVASLRFRDAFSGAPADTHSPLITDLSVRRYTPSAPARYANFRDNPDAQVNKSARILNLHAVSVFGDHDLPRVPIEGLPDGLLFSDVLRYLVGLYGGGLATELHGIDTIEDSSFASPRLAWFEPTDLGSILEEGIALEADRDWAVWEAKVLHYRERMAMGRTWTFRRSEGAQYVPAGATAEPDYNGVIVTYCVDPETECLTKRGWQTHDTLLDDDELLAFDPETKTTCWECPREIFVGNYDGEMIRFDGRLEALTTPNHRWPIYNRPRHGRSPFVKVATSETLPNEGYIIRNAPYSGAPLSPVFSDEFVRLVAWYTTEGHLGEDGKRIRITQSLAVNPGNVESIRSDLAAVGTPGIGHVGHPPGKGRWPGLRFSEYARSDNECVTFVVSGIEVDWIIRAAPGKAKVPTMEFLLSLTAEQLDIYLNTCIAGDGWDKRRHFYQHHAGRMDAYTVAAVLAGKCPTLHNHGTACALNEHRTGTSLAKVKRERVPYQGVVWCPVTRAGHWVARRKGKVFITGNSDKDGTPRWAGPPGSGADVEDAALVDTDPENPVNASRAVPNRYLTVDLDTADSEKAIRVGEIALAESLRPRFAGELRLPRYAEREGETLPTSLLRAGDRVLDGDVVGSEEMLLVETAYRRSDGAQPMSATVDLPANRLDAAIARMGAKPRKVGRSRIRRDLRHQRRHTLRRRRKAKRRRERQGHD